MYRSQRPLTTTIALLCLILTTSLVTIGMQRHPAHADGPPPPIFTATYEANDKVYCYANELRNNAPLTIMIGNALYTTVASSKGIITQWLPAPHGVVASIVNVDLVQDYPGGTTHYSTTVFLPPTLTVKRQTKDGAWFITGYRHDATQGISVTLTNTSDGTMQTLATIAPQSTTPYSIALHVAAPTLISGVQYMLSASDVATGYSGSVVFVAP